LKADQKERTLIISCRWSAVARGAVAKGIDRVSLVTERKCRYHYGAPISKQFDPSQHSTEDMYIEELTGEKYATGTYQISFL